MKSTSPAASIVILPPVLPSAPVLLLAVPWSSAAGPASAFWPPWVVLPPPPPPLSLPPPQAAIPNMAPAASMGSRTLVRDRDIERPFSRTDTASALRFAAASSLSAARVERVLQPVAHQVEGEHGEQQGEPGEQHVPPRIGELARRLGDHRAPRRCRPLHADAEERQRRLEQDVHRDEQGRVDDQRRHQVRQDVAADDPAVRRAERTRGLDELLLPQRQRLPAHDARDVGPREQ